MTILPRTTIFRKALMAVSGLVWGMFLVGHLSGNFLLYAGPQAYNRYAHSLVTNPFIYVAEAMLVLAFLAHVVSGISLTLGSRAARPVGYAVRRMKGDIDLPSDWMMVSGATVLGFLLLHIVTFKYGADVTAPGADGVRQLYDLVVARFAQPWYAGVYLLCLTVLALHLRHAIRSVVRTLGVTHAGLLRIADMAALAAAVGFWLGFSSFVIWFGILHRAGG